MSLKKQYPNIDGFIPLDELTPRMIVYRAAAEIASDVGRVSPYSGGTVGGLLEGMHDVNQ